MLASCRRQRHRRAASRLACRCHNSAPEPTRDPAASDKPVSLIEDVTAEIDIVFRSIKGAVIGMHRRMSNVRRRIVLHAVFGVLVAHSAARIAPAVRVNFIE